MSSLLIEPIMFCKSCDHFPPFQAFLLVLFRVNAFLCWLPISPLRASLLFALCSCICGLCWVLVVIQLFQIFLLEVSFLNFLSHNSFCSAHRRSLSKKTLTNSSPLLPLTVVYFVWLYYKIQCHSCQEIQWGIWLSNSEVVDSKLSISPAISLICISNSLSLDEKTDLLGNQISSKFDENFEHYICTEFPRLNKLDTSLIICQRGKFLQNYKKSNICSGFVTYLIITQIWYFGYYLTLIWLPLQTYEVFAIKLIIKQI